MTLATICFSTTVGGLELATLRRASEMVAEGHSAVAILRADAVDLAASARAMGLTVHTIPVRFSYYDVFAARAVRKVINQRGVQLLLVARTRDLSTATLAAREDTAVVLYHQMQSGIVKRDWLHNRLYRRLDACIAITDRQRSQLLSTTVLDDSRIHVIPYGVDIQKYSPSSHPVESARARFGLPAGAFVVGIVGGFTEGKGQREFLHALEIVCARLPGVADRLWALVVGERPGDARPYTGELKALRDASTIADQIVFSPFIDDPSIAYRAMDVFVLASHSETFGMVVQEAMATGVAVIATNEGGVPEIVTNGATGLLVPARSADAIADAIIDLVGDDDLRLRLANAGRARVVARYDPRAAYNRFVNVLLSAIERRRSR